MSQTNADKADRLRKAAQNNGDDHSGRQATRSVMREVLKGTKLPAGSVCDTFIPLQNPKKRERANVDQAGLGDLIQDIERSKQTDLSDIADQWHLTHDAPPVR
ncbi:hypothetical protein [Pseudomonas sp. S1_E04]